MNIRRDDEKFRTSLNTPIIDIFKKKKKRNK